MATFEVPVYITYEKVKYFQVEAEDFLEACSTALSEAKEEESSDSDLNYPCAVQVARMLDARSVDTREE